MRARITPFVAPTADAAGRWRGAAFFFRSVGALARAAALLRALNAAARSVRRGAAGAAADAATFCEVSAPLARLGAAPAALSSANGAASAAATIHAEGAAIARALSGNAVLLPSRGRPGARVLALLTGRIVAARRACAPPWRLPLLLAALPITVDVGRAFSGRLAALAARARTVEGVVAFISTLGGGHFLCRHVPAAITLAKLQLRVARAAGDAPGARRALLHLVYVCALVGRWGEGRRLLRRAEAGAGAAGDGGFAGLAEAARSALRRARRLAGRGGLAAPPREPRRDDLHRVRIVAFGEGSVAAGVV